MLCRLHSVHIGAAWLVIGRQLIETSLLVGSTLKHRRPMMGSLVCTACRSKASFSLHRNHRWYVHMPSRRQSRNRTSS